MPDLPGKVLCPNVVPGELAKRDMLFESEWLRETAVEVSKRKARM
jgi:hypothetical protein